MAVSGTGLVRCPAGAQRALELLAAAGRTDVPVGVRARPIRWPASTPSRLRGATPRTRSSAFRCRPPSGRPDARGAVALLHDTIAAERPTRCNSSRSAPLTDVAALLRAHPADRSRLAGIHAMAGAVDVPGNIGAGHEGAEYNLWVDPVAADEVLRSGIPVTLIPLDATNDVPVTVAFSLALERAHYATRAGALAEALIRVTRMHAGGRYFWDPLAAATLAAPAVVTLRSERLRVTRDGRLVRDPARPACAWPSRRTAPASSASCCTPWWAGHASPSRRSTSGPRSSASRRAAAIAGHRAAPRRARARSTPATAPTRR